MVKTNDTNQYQLIIACDRRFHVLIIIVFLHSGQVWGHMPEQRVHLVTVLLRPPSGHRPGRRQARHVHILQIGLRLAIVQADARSAMPISFR